MIDEPSCLELTEEALILCCLLLLLDLCYLIKDRSQNEQIKAAVDESVRLWELVEVNAWVGGKFPVVFWGHWLVQRVCCLLKRCGSCFLLLHF